MNFISYDCVRGVSIVVRVRDQCCHHLGMIGPARANLSKFTPIKLNLWVILVKRSDLPGPKSPGEMID